jgi:hypothetical protein
MDPINNSLLRTFECSIHDLSRFTSSTWEPPVKLTTHERDIVEKNGSVLLQGRGGTGKTLCLISRLEYCVKFTIQKLGLWCCCRVFRSSKHILKPENAMFDSRHRLYKDFSAALHRLAAEPISVSRPRILFVSYSHRNQYQGLRLLFIFFTDF